MNIDKAIRKQKKSYKRFVLSMSFIFFTLPTALIISKKFYIFYIIYLIIVECLILMSIFIRINKETLKFQYDGYKFKILLGISSKKINILCDKVFIVHVEDSSSNKDEKNDFKIILIASSKFRSERMLPISLKFLQKHPYVAYQYARMKMLYPEYDFYYTVIKRGGLSKYPLLDAIYKSCVHAYFTEDTIEKIKFYRENSQYY